MIMINKEKNQLVMITLDKDVLKSMNKVCIAISKAAKMNFTKSMLITKIYTEWLEFQNQEIEQALKEQNSEEEKKNA